MFHHPQNAQLQAGRWEQPWNCHHHCGPHRGAASRLMHCAQVAEALRDALHQRHEPSEALRADLQEVGIVRSDGKWWK